MTDTATTSKRKKIAIIAVHGVCPHPRYEIQDDFAEGLRSALSGPTATGNAWKKAILWPTVATPQARAGDLNATAVRLYQGADPEKAAVLYDIFEGYWSPIDKNQTSVAAVLQWLLQSLFAPLNGYSKLYASTWKTLGDILYLTGALAFVVALLSLFGIIAARAWYVYAALATCAPTNITWKVALDWAPICAAKTPVPGFFAIFFHPTDIYNGIGPRAALILLIAAIAAYAAWQFVFSFIMDVQRFFKRITRARAKDVRARQGRRTFWRFYMQGALALTSAFCFWLIIYHLPIIGRGGGALDNSAFPATILVVAVGALKAALAFLQGFLINFMGDVQIYCTHDENAKFFQMRKAILQAVETVILGVLRTDVEHPPHATAMRFAATAEEREREPAPYYDAVFIAAHSLGSTIAMDALINIHELVEENGLDEHLWRRLRGLITFGTSLEKTKFFFDVRNPSYSASVQQWRDDVYGHLFTDDFTVLTQPNTGKKNAGIYWANFWYLPDLVANEVVSYKSAIAPGSELLFHPAGATRTVCQNVRLGSTFPRQLWVHGNYLGDQAFWASGTDRMGKDYNGAVAIVSS
jgi:hypothetical protein